MFKPVPHRSIGPDTWESSGEPLEVPNIEIGVHNSGVWTQPPHPSQPGLHIASLESRGEDLRVVLLDGLAAVKDRAENVDELPILRIVRSPALAIASIPGVIQSSDDRPNRVLLRLRYYLLRPRGNGHAGNHREDETRDSDRLYPHVLTPEPKSVLLQRPNNVCAHQHNI